MFKRYQLLYYFSTFYLPYCFECISKRRTHGIPVLMERNGMNQAANKQKKDISV